MGVPGPQDGDKSPLLAGSLTLYEAPWCPLPWRGQDKGMGSTNLDHRVNRFLAAASTALPSSLCCQGRSYFKQQVFVSGDRNTPAVGGKGHHMLWCLAGVIYSIISAPALTQQLWLPQCWHWTHWVYH